jgi:DNA replication protein DnaC
MSEKISETLKRLADDTSKVNSPSSSSADRPRGPGDPDCPICHGSGYLRRELPIEHPDFGRLDICACRAAEVEQHARQRLFSLSQLDQLRTLTFDSFSPRGRPGMPAFNQDSLEQAFHLARTYAAQPQGWLFLQGRFGCGKTHLAAAIANSCVDQGRPTLFLTVPDLLDMLRFAYSAEDVTFEERFDQIRTAHLLILDDFGTQHATEWAREKLFQILNYRYINRLPTVLTSNLSLEDIEGRLRSRLLDGQLVQRVMIMAPDYRQATQDIGHHELSTLALHARQTFGTFSMREEERFNKDDRSSLKLAFEASRAYGEDPAGWMVLVGPHGSGKTHLAAAIANYRASMGEMVMFLPVPDLLDHLRATFNPARVESYDRRFDEIRRSTLIVLDDLGTQASTPWAQEKIYQLINYRYNAELPTVITTAVELEKLEPRLTSRMLDTRLSGIYAITAPSYIEGRIRRRPAR